jgi:hypothetical protein
MIKHDHVGWPMCVIRKQAALCGILLAAMLGCSRSERVPVEGVVTIDGKPMDKGSIQFIPMAGTNGPTSGGNIANGKFAIASVNGPFAGKFTVQINSPGPTGRKVVDLVTKQMIDEYGERLPAKYNRESQLQVEVTAKGKNRFDFAATSGKTGTAQ